VRRKLVAKYAGSDAEISGAKKKQIFRLMPEVSWERQMNITISSAVNADAMLRIRWDIREPWIE